MQRLLSNYKVWFETWNELSPSLRRLFNIFQTSTQFKKFKHRFNILKTIIVSLTIVVGAFTFYNLIALLTLPLMLVLFLFIYYSRSILSEKYLVTPNKKLIEHVIKPKKHDIIELIDFLKSL